MGLESHMDPTDEISLEAVKSRAVRGVVVLTGRTFLLSVLSLVATGFLTVFLDPKEFGIFWIVSAIVNFLSYFSDIGLAAALIQKKEALEKDDLKTTFTVQQLLVIAILIVLVILSPILSRIYGLSSAGRILLYSLGLSLLFSSFKTIPSVLLERRLEFGKLVIPQVLENLVYNILAVILAWKGFGIYSFAIAVLARSLVGLIAIYILQPWIPGFALSRKSLKKLLSFGIPYQANSLLATIKDDGMTAVLGGILGPAGVGILGWAQKWGQAPLRFFMDHVIKVTFPAFARMQDAKDVLTRSLNRSIFFICFLVFPSLAGLLVVAPILVQIIPKYQKWEPALIPLGLIAINTLFAAVTTQLTNLLNSIGKIKITFKLMIMWTVLSWLLIPILSVKYSIIGAAAGYAIVGASSLIAIFITWRIVKFSIFESVLKPFIAAVIMTIVLLIIRHNLSISLLSVFILIGLGIITYAVNVYLLIGSSIITDVKKSFQTFFSK
ncbi:MAG TPA: oligosaccharide flippase family protein [Patescibacteria group bacterium]|nr:oligosaccharide flippase family protein [Patescibacteria group bacterium]